MQLFFKERLPETSSRVQEETIHDSTGDHQPFYSFSALQTGRKVKDEITTEQSTGHVQVVFSTRGSLYRIIFFRVGVGGIPPP